MESGPRARESSGPRFSEQSGHPSAQPRSLGQALLEGNEGHEAGVVCRMPGGLGKLLMLERQILAGSFTCILRVVKARKEGDPNVDLRPVQARWGQQRSPQLTAFPSAAVSGLHPQPVHSI